MHPIHSGGLTVVRIQQANPSSAVHPADPTSAQLTVNDLSKQAKIDLLGPNDTEEEARQHLQRRRQEIFEEQLGGWYRVPTAWPVDRSFKTFKYWFEHHFHSVLIDLCSHPIIWDEL
jgi:hypothetical protein